MTKTVVTLNETATLQDAINTMAEKMINRLPVVDSKNKLVGIVTRTDIVHQLSQLKAV
jgi:tRNA nucleotidyltransferase (CCA-adding enzyme)